MARQRSLARKEQTELERWDPWDTFREMERMFRDFFISPFSWARRPIWAGDFEPRFTPEVDLRETDKEFVLSATLPGIDKEDIDINVTSDSISVSGERKYEEEKPDEKYHIRQQGYGKFHVCYNLPSEVRPKDVKAVYKNGVLEVTMPKAAETEVGHKVKVE